MNEFTKEPIEFPTFASSDEDEAFLPRGGYLEGQLLVATPTVSGDVFAQSVIYLFAHNAHGAMGVIINKPLEMVHYASLFQQLGIEVTANAQDLPVGMGGPVEGSRGFVLHTPDYKSPESLAGDGHIVLTANAKVLRDIAAGTGPQQALMTIGYAGWAPGQLEAEIEANSWITVPATPELIFDTPDDTKWALAAKSLGIDMGRFSSFAGHA